MKFTHNQQQAIRTALHTWLHTAREAEYPAVVDVPTQLHAEIDHSALLYRLLQGDEPHETPPPLAYSYPWYDLIETGRADNCEAAIFPEGTKVVTGPFALICQGVWRLIEQVGDDCAIVTHERTPGVLWRLTRMDSVTPFTWSLERLT